MDPIGVVAVGILLLGLTGAPAPADEVTPVVTAVEESIEVKGPVTPATSITPELVEFANKKGLPLDKRISIGVGDIHDATGKFMSGGEGTASRIISQAPGLFMKSALQKLEYFKVLERSRSGFELFMQEQDLRGKKRLASGDSRPELNKIIGAPLIVTGAITSFQFDVETKGKTGKVAGSGVESIYAVATVQADFVLIDTTTSETEIFSYIDTIEGKKEGANIYSFMGSDYLLDFQSGKSEEAVYDLVVRRVCEWAALDIAESFLVGRYMEGVNENGGENNN